MQAFYVAVVFTSAEDPESTVTARSSENGCGSVDSASLRTSCHPVYTLNCHSVFHLKRDVRRSETEWFSWVIRLLLFRSLCSSRSWKFRRRMDTRICSCL